MTDPGQDQRIAQRVRARREELGLTQEAAAVLGEISASQWRVVETARRAKFRPATRRGVTRALGWTLDSLDRIERGEEPLLAGPSTPLVGDLGGRVSRLEDQMAEVLGVLRQMDTGPDDGEASR